MISEGSISGVKSRRRGSFCFAMKASNLQKSPSELWNDPVGQAFESPLEKYAAETWFEESGHHAENKRGKGDDNAGDNAGDHASRSRWRRGRVTGTREYKVCKGINTATRCFTTHHNANSRCRIRFRPGNRLRRPSSHTRQFTCWYGSKRTLLVASISRHKENVCLSGGARK